MDLYRERPGLWPDVHIGLITAMRDALQENDSDWFFSS
jgi:hypothetical protein